MPHPGCLEDLEAIKKLKSRYFYCLDHKDWDGWRDHVFIAKPVIDVPEAWAEPKTGLEPFIESVVDVVAGAASVHHGHMPDIEFTSADAAHGVWAMEDVIHWREDRPFQGKYTYLHGFGHYHEDYVRTANGWRIASLLLTRLHLELR